VSVIGQRVLEIGDGFEPETELSAFSSDDASPTEWASAREHLEAAEVFWLSTVRPDGRPHVTPLLAVWSDAALYFCTSPSERKAKNLGDNPDCILTTGRNGLDGLDVVVEGKAREVPARLHRTRRHLVRARRRHSRRGLAAVPRRSGDRVRVRQGRVLQPDPVPLLGGGSFMSWRSVV
jgi:nitroimidazol reductase NimA-like FMN-containing flavoprotein (pyridoxamine 5'-phosphate oxidase superfamily)